MCEIKLGMYLEDMSSLRRSDDLRSPFQAPSQVQNVFPKFPPSSTLINPSVVTAPSPACFYSGSPSSTTSDVSPPSPMSSGPGTALLPWDAPRWCVYTIVLQQLAPG